MRAIIPSNPESNKDITKNSTAENDIPAEYRKSSYLLTHLRGSSFSRGFARKRRNLISAKFNHLGSLRFIINTISVEIAGKANSRITANA